MERSIKYCWRCKIATNRIKVATVVKINSLIQGSILQRFKEGSARHRVAVRRYGGWQASWRFIRVMVAACSSSPFWSSWSSIRRIHLTSRRNDNQKRELDCVERWSIISCYELRRNVTSRGGEGKCTRRASSDKKTSWQGGRWREREVDRGNDGKPRENSATRSCVFTFEDNREKYRNPSFNRIKYSRISLSSSFVAKKKKRKKWFRISVYATQWLNFVEKLNVYPERRNLHNEGSKLLLFERLDPLSFIGIRERRRSRASQRRFYSVNVVIYNVEKFRITHVSCVEIVWSGR